MIFLTTNIHSFNLIIKNYYYIFLIRKKSDTSKILQFYKFMVKKEDMHIFTVRLNYST